MLNKINYLLFLLCIEGCLYWAPEAEVRGSNPLGRTKTKKPALCRLFGFGLLDR